jgi:C4-dicarboxylate-specific signal transduction histidine kinase
MSVSEMQSAVAHELNNPLAALVNYLRSAKLLLAQSPGASEPLRSTIEKADAEATRSIEVLRNLRNLYRGGTAQRRSLDPKKSILEVVAGLRNRLQAADISWELDMPATVPLVVADPLQLSMVMQNLLDNAVDATAASAGPQRKIVVNVAQRSSELVIQVNDSGSGIPGELAAQLFRPVLSSKPGGLGLGLAICRALVEGSDGRIWLVRTGAAGTQIAFSLPVQAQ